MNVENSLKRLIKATWTMHPPHPMVFVPKREDDRDALVMARAELLYFMGLGALNMESLIRQNSVSVKDRPDYTMEGVRTVKDGAYARWQGKTEFTLSWLCTHSGRAFVDEDDEDLIDFVRCGGHENAELGENLWPEAVECINATLSLTVSDAHVAIWQNDRAADYHRARPDPASARERIALTFAGGPPEIVRSCR